LLVFFFAAYIMFSMESTPCSGPRNTLLVILRLVFRPKVVPELPQVTKVGDSFVVVMPDDTFQVGVHTLLVHSAAVADGS